MEKTKKNLFLTGKAGTGKSTLLDFFRTSSTKKLAILAPTGVAAVNVSGETIHAFFGLKPGFELPESYEISKKPKNPSLYKRIETIVIDEISMVRADLIDAVDVFLRNARKNPLPFGGVQMIFIGDIYQLPPVLTESDKAVFYEEYKYESPYFFDANVFKRNDYIMDFIELSTIYRQSDAEFINLLNAVRNNRLLHNDILKLNARYDPDFYPDKDSGYISLCTTNKDANLINEKNIEAIESAEYTSECVIEGEIQSNQFPADEYLILKEGAQIIFLNNDAQRRWVNGSIGHIVLIHTTEHFLLVSVNEDIVKVEPHTWEISKYVIEEGELKRKMLGSFTQFPLRLAWAITIHKSQGKTFDRVIIDFGRGTFAHGQAYVALSRCKSLDGISFRKKLKKNDVIMDTKVLAFLAPFRYDLSQQAISLEQKKQKLQKSRDQQSIIRISYFLSADETTMKEIIPTDLQTIEWNGTQVDIVVANDLQSSNLQQLSLHRILWIWD